MVLRGNDWRALAGGRPQPGVAVEVVVADGVQLPDEVVAGLGRAAALPDRVVAVVVDAEAEPGPLTALPGSGWRAAAALAGTPGLAVTRALLDQARRPSTSGRVPEGVAELLHRLSQLGAALVPVPGARLEPGRERTPLAAARAAHRLPLGRADRRVSGRVWEVPVVVVDLDPGTADAAELVATVDALLSSTVEDLVVAVRPGPHDALLAAVHAGHPRVALGSASRAVRDDVDVPFLLTWAVPVAPGPRTVEHLLVTADRRVCAAVGVLTAGTPVRPVLWRRAALARLVDAGAPLPELPTTAAAEATGTVWWVDAGSVGAGARGTSQYHSRVWWERSDTPTSTAVRRAEAQAVQADQRAARAEQALAELTERSRTGWRARLTGR